MVSIIMLAGHNTNEASIENKIKEFYKRFNVHYLEGLPKGRDIIIDGAPLIVNQFDKYNAIAQEINGKVYVAGPEEIYSNFIPNKSIIDTNGGPLDNLLNALKIVNDKKIIITTIDIPLADKEMTLKYIEKALSSESDAIVQMVKKKNFESLHLDYDKPGYFLEGNERYIMGHIEVLNTDKVNMELVYRIANTLNDIKGMNMAKKVHRLISEFKEDIPLGMIFNSSIKYATKNMSIEYAEKALKKIINGSVRILLADAEFSADIDTFEEVYSMKKYLNIEVREEALEYQNKLYDKLGIHIYLP